MIALRKIGGMRYLRLGQLQISWCVVRKDRPAKARKPSRATLQAKIGKQDREINFAYSWLREMGEDNRRLVRRLDTANRQITNLVLYGSTGA
jgi:hypothetical protein